MQRLKIIILLAGICGFGLVPQWYGQAAALDSDTQQACRQIDFYFTLDCPHCRRALAYLSDLEQRHPEVRIQRFEIKQDQEAFARFIEYHEQFGIEQPGVPFFLLCDHYLTGFDKPETTGRIIEESLGLSTQADNHTMSETGPIKLPLIGEVTAEEYGLPLFTIAIGLIDGFNPCAMWVLLFLLSLLVNLKSRARILLVAGTFVLVSGLVYYAFMAAWLNLFLIIGFSRLLQVFVGLVAVMIGLIHVKDYFALKQGVSLSIPETAKPGLYQRMRDIIYAKSLWAALVAVILLAILVNLIELLCTAGLPAVYTQILSGRELPTSSYYAYLVLYNLAYIFDDALMVGIVVFTLSKTKLQESAGRLLKLLSGSVLVLLGIGLLLFPKLLF